MRRGLALLVCGGVMALASAVMAQTRSLQGGPVEAVPVPAIDPATLQGLLSAHDYRPPEGIRFKATDLISDNVRLTAQWFYAAENEGRKLPTVVMAAGWGATAATLRQDAVDLAKAGYMVMLFDYRGWGESDGRVALTGERPAGGGTFTAPVRELRGYIDPWEQAEDWSNAISYAASDPMVDAGRIGVLGADLAGGHVVQVAARERRIKAMVSLVTRADLRPSKPYQSDPAQALAEANAAAARLANGQGRYPTDGAAVGTKAVRWAPVEVANEVTAPALFVLAEKEELFSNPKNGQLACERVMGPRRMMILPKITHYDIYGAERDRAVGAAIDWFDRYLKGMAPPPPASGKKAAPERGECNPPPEPPKGEDETDGSGAARQVQDASGRYN